MKTIRKCTVLLPLLAMFLPACDDSITEFGFTGSLSGVVHDPDGNPVSGNVATEDLAVLALGEDELDPLELRVYGDGTYANTHLYPQMYSVWVDGPVASEATVENPVIIDLTGSSETLDFMVTPFLRIPAPTAGQASGGSVDVTYEIIPDTGHEVQGGENRILYASTRAWPGSTTGNFLPNTHTVITTLPDNSGTVTVEGLIEGRRYHLRIGARAVGETRWNLSDQATVEIP